MKLGSQNIADKVLIIAEIGANHEGDFDAARRLVDEAARCGVDAVKFQTYRAEKIVAVSETQRRQHFKRLELTESQFEGLARHAGERGVVFLSTPFDLASVDFLDPLVPYFKAASGDLTCDPLIRHLASKGKPILLSTGMGTLEDVVRAVDLIEKHNDRLSSEEKVVLLHCVSSYPTPDTEANLLSIPFLKEATGRPVGYSDHTLGVEACIAAVALGARVVEKHFTLDKSRDTFRDHQLSSDPDDMAHLVKSLRRVEAMLGVPRKSPTDSEAPNRFSMRRSLAAAVSIRRGEFLLPEMVTFLRPGTGIPPSEQPLTVGMKAARDLIPGEILTWEDLEKP